MELFNQILFWVNYILVGLISVAFTTQLLYIFFFWVPKKTYKPAKVKHRVGIIIPARNESAVIGDTVKCLFNSDYPKELFDVFVVADNCTDNTAEIARNAGAIVFEHFDDDPRHKKAGYALQYGFEKIMADYDRYDFFIKFDADNLMEPDYISKMNDAFDAGVMSARGYSNSKNLTENVVSGISGLWYIRDCRYSCHVRAFLNTTQMLGGAGMMFSAEIIRKHGGWDCLSSSDDAEFAMNRLLEGIKTKYVADAIVYEDQPTTVADTFKRNKRMGRGLFKLFFTKGIPSLGKFFYKFGWSYLDMFFNLLFVPIAVLCCIWLPLYYGYDIIYHFATGDAAYGWNAIQNICWLLAFAFVVPFILQALLAVVLERKRIRASFKQMVPTILCFPLFMIIYAISITIGVFSKPKWSAVKRSTAVSSAELFGGSAAESAALPAKEATAAETTDGAGETDAGAQPADAVTEAEIIAETDTAAAEAAAAFDGDAVPEMTDEEAVLP